MKSALRLLKKLIAYASYDIRNRMYRERWRQFRENSSEEDDPYD